MNMINDKNPAPFPITVLPEFFQQVAQRIHAETQSPIPLICSTMLSVMSMSVQDLYDVAPKHNMKSLLTLYLIVLAESGERKSTVYKLLMQSIFDIEYIWEMEYQKELLTYQAELPIWEIKINALRKKLQQEVKNGTDTESSSSELKKCELQRPQEPVRKRFIINDTSKAALKKELGNGWQSLQGRRMIILCTS